MKGIKPTFKIIIYICLVLGFIISIASWLVKPVNHNPVISVDEVVGLSDEDIISRLFIMRLRSYPALQDCKIINVKKHTYLNNKISFDVKYQVKPDPDPDSDIYWSAGASTHLDDNWIGKDDEVELIKEDNRYRIKIVGP